MSNWIRIIGAIVPLIKSLPPPKPWLQSAIKGREDNTSMKQEAQLSYTSAEKTQTDALKKITRVQEIKRLMFISYQL